MELEIKAEVLSSFSNLIVLKLFNYFSFQYNLIPFYF